MLKKQNYPSASKSAFTLFEVLIVILIMGIITAVIISNSMGNRRSYVSQAAVSLGNDISVVRSEAITRNTPLKITFSPDGSYTVSDAQGIISLAGNDHFKRQLANGVLIDSVNFGAGNAIYFSSEGRPVAGSFESLQAISPSNSLVLKLGEYSKTISLNPVTGKVKISN